MAHPNPFIRFIFAEFQTCFKLRDDRAMQRLAFFQPATPDEVSNIIKNLKMKNSSGLDDIPIKLLKYVDEIIAVPFSHCFRIVNMVAACINQLYVGNLRISR